EVYQRGYAARLLELPAVGSWPKAGRVGVVKGASYTMLGLERSPVTTFRRRLASPCTRPWSLRRPAPGDRTTVGLASTPSISHGTRWGRRFPMRDASPTVSMYWVTWFAGAIWKNRLIHAIVRQIVWIMTPRDCSEDPRVPLQQFVRP